VHPPVPSVLQHEVIEFENLSLQQACSVSKISFSQASVWEKHQLFSHTAGLVVIEICQMKGAD
jgi:hypothetical protein